MENIKLFDSEYRLLNIIWKPEPVNSALLTKFCLLYGTEKIEGVKFC